MDINYNKYQSGSIWRKWDLQVQPTKNEWLGDVNHHTDQIEAATKSFLEIAHSKQIEVVSITDHNTGVAIDYALGSELVEIIPGVELDTKEGWHLLVLFNKEYKEKLRLTTWKEVVDMFLTGTCEIQSPFFDNQNIAKKIGCTTDTLLKRITSENIGIPVFAHCCSNDGFFTKGADTPGRKDIIDLFINGTAKFAFEIKDNTDQITQINDKIRGWYNGKEINIPILSSSDAHKALDVGSTFSWIKADPTFEGLKQILFEPLERICIQSEKPDTKKVYDIIEKVKFQDTNFTTSEILMSENLTAIIGGKSTGKSILLKNIAKCVDIEEYNRRNSSIGIDDRKPIKGFEVFWKDQQVSILDGGDKNPNKRIIYIPQSYLNRVVDKEEQTTDIDGIIKDVLLQDDEFGTWHRELSSREKTISTEVEDIIRDLYSNIDKYKICVEEIKKKGDKDGLNTQIQILKTEIAEHQKEIEFDQGELELYNLKTEIIKQEKSKIELISGDLNKLQITKNLSVSYPETESFLFEETTSELDKLITNKRKQYQDDWSEGIGLVISKLNTLNLQAVEVVFQAEKEILIVKEKIESQKTLKGKIEALVVEEKKVEEIALLQLEKDRSFSNIKECTAKLSSKNAEYYSIYLEAKSHVNLEGLDEELTFSIDTVFSNKRFGENFVDKFFDGRSLRSNVYDFFANYDFDSKQKHEEFIKDLIWKILTKKDFPFNKNVEKREVITALSQNWFLHDYKVGYQGDELIDMSPGKKSFVLLRLLIDLDNSECPILVDQPEDDLDNRSIYDDIVAFLNRRKKKRQIIIVTHNPNLVLGSDAELVIVANQDGEDTRNKNNKFEYVSGAIEHSIDDNDKINEVLLRRGIQEHICSILEGGEEAFNKRRNKYRFSR